MAQNNLGFSMRSATRTRPNRPPRLTVDMAADLFGELEQMAEDQDRPLSALCRRLSAARSSVNKRRSSLRSTMSEATHAAEQLEWFLRKLDAFQEVAALLKKYGSLENATAEATAALKALNDQRKPPPSISRD